MSAPAAKLTSDPFCVLLRDSWKVSDFFNEINNFRMKSHQHGPPLKTLLRAVHSLGQTAPHDFAIWNLGAELALAAFCLSYLLNMLLFWSASNLPCSLCCLLLYWESMGVYCATGCTTNCLTMSFLNVVGLCLLYKMSFTFSISCINVSTALRTEWWSQKTIGYLEKFTYSDDNYR